MVPAIIIAFFLVVFFLIWVNAQPSKNNDTFDAELDARGDEVMSSNKRMEEAFQKHKDVLNRKMKLLIKTDDYGYEDRSSWENEKKYFIQRICPRNDYPRLWKEYDEEIENTLLMSNINATDEWANEFFRGDRFQADEYIRRYRDEYDNLIERGLPGFLDGFRNKIETWLYEEGINSNTYYEETFSGVEYESYCADILESIGWKTKLTSNTGDQGIDIIASQLDTTIVIQCKKYTSPVGNKAVQEAVAGMGYMNANGACVVSNSTFTKSAKELANATGIKLIHHDELKSLTPSDFWQKNN